MNMQKRFFAYAMGATLMLATHVASAQAVGDVVRIETDSGAIEGTLMDKTADGYLVRFGSTAQLVRASDVKSITVVSRAPAGDATPPPAPPPPTTTTEPAPAPPPPPSATTAAPPPTPPPPSQPESPPPQKPKPSSPGLVAGGISALVFGSIGMVVGGILLPIGAAVSSSNTCHDPNRTLEFDCEYGNASDMVTGGAITLGVGAALVAGGIVMIVAGSSPKKQTGQAMPRLRASNGGLGWAF
jgi:hypothetical protein